MAIPNSNSPTLAPPRITAARFKQLLKTKNSPAVPESDGVYSYLVSKGVDVSFALAQFRVESQYGTAGYAKTSGSWGNMLYDAHLTTHSDGIYCPGNGYCYAKYNNYMDAINDYCTYIHWYKDEYGLDTIYEATARWIGKTPGAAGHISYVNTIINDMIMYEYPQGGYESGDKMIFFGDAFDRSTGKIVQKYPVTTGLALYRGTSTNSDGTPSDLLKKYSGDPGKAWWLGFVNGGKDWGALVIGTSAADPDATVVYIFKPDARKIVRA